MTTCDPSRRPDQATQRLALDVLRAFVTIGYPGAADAAHDIAADAGCPACCDDLLRRPALRSRSWLQVAAGELVVTEGYPRASPWRWPT